MQKLSKLFLVHGFLLISCAVSARAIKVVVASKSPQKIAAVKQAFEELFYCSSVEDDWVEIVSCKSTSLVPEQPVGLDVAVAGAKNRIQSVPADLLADADYVVAIENFIQPSSTDLFWNDKGLVLVKNLTEPSRDIMYCTQPTLIPVKFVQLAQQRATPAGITEQGYGVTVGSVIAASMAPRAVDAQDWHREEEFGGISRQQLLHDALFKALRTNKIELLKKKIVNYPDFPKPGIVFEDFLPILNDAQAFQVCVDLLADRYKNESIDQIVGLESRGFILGAALALKLRVGFVPVRKPGKLPGATYSVSYKKEYGSDMLVIAQTALKPGSRILIIDDLIATGGSARAAIELVTLAGGLPVAFVTLLQVKELADLAHLKVPAFNLLD